MWRRISPGLRLLSGGIVTSNGAPRGTPSHCQLESNKRQLQRAVGLLLYHCLQWG